MYHAAYRRNGASNEATLWASQYMQVVHEIGMVGSGSCLFLVARGFTCRIFSSSSSSSFFSGFGGKRYRVHGKSHSLIAVATLSLALASRGSYGVHCIPTVPCDFEQASPLPQHTTPHHTVSLRSSVAVRPIAEFAPVDVNFASLADILFSVSSAIGRSRLLSD